MASSRHKEGGISEKMILDYVKGGRGLAKDDLLCLKYVSFLIDNYKLYKNVPMYMFITYFNSFPVSKI